jgi:SAM-dependent methyltransferase
MTLTGWLRYDRVRPLVPPGTVSILEIGCGMGAMGALLAQSYEYTGIEPDARSFAAARARVVGGRVFNVDAAGFGCGEFDLVCAFEVLEHIEDDVAALREWASFARPGGRMLVSVPAGSAKFGAADERVGHFRRYDPADLIAVMLAAGMAAPEVVPYAFPLGYVLEGARGMLARHSSTSDDVAERTAGSGRWLQPPDWLSLGSWAVAWPFRVAQRHAGFGTGLIGAGDVGFDDRGVVGRPESHVEIVDSGTSISR